MRFNPFEWEEINVEETRSAPKGRLWLRCSEECAVYLTAQGYEVLGAVGREIDLTLSEENVTYRVEAPPNARVFVYSPRVQFIEPEGEVFTNPDRLPSESGTLMETRRAMRLFQIEQQALLRQMREDAAKLRQEAEQGATPTTPTEATELPPVAPETGPETALEQPGAAKA